jgi:hypothetical protein
MTVNADISVTHFGMVHSVTSFIKTFDVHTTWQHPERQRYADFLKDDPHRNGYTVKVVLKGTPGYAL